MTNREPIAYVNVQEQTLEWAIPVRWITPTTIYLDKIPLYLDSTIWNGLTKEEAAKCWCTSAEKTWLAIEAKLKEKNT